MSLGTAASLGTSTIASTTALPAYRSSSSIKSTSPTSYHCLSMLALWSSLLLSLSASGELLCRANVYYDILKGWTFIIYRSVKESGLICHDSGLSEDSDADPQSCKCLILPDLFVGTGDGPWQSELSSHSGDAHPCRFCTMGGNTKERPSDEGFMAIMEVSM